MMLRSSDELEQIIGLRIKNLRIHNNLKQEELAARANVSKSALFNLESGKGSTIKTLVSVLDALGESGWIDTLAPDIKLSPIQLMELGKRRQRVRK